MRFHIKERRLTLKDDFIILDENKNEAYEVNGKFINIGDHFTMRDKNTGQEILQIKQRVFAHTRQYEIFANETELATLRRKPEPGPQEERFEITTRDGMILHIHGDFKEWDFKLIDHYGRLLGNISREWSIFSDHYTVDIAAGVDAPFILALAVILDEIREDFGKD